MSHTRPSQFFRERERKRESSFAKWSTETSDFQREKRIGGFAWGRNNEVSFQIFIDKFWKERDE